ncbi:LapA family protein [Sinirhodobacter sp. WL0062]|uniref:LapA family protein n=1 Tax=Rhodobacter flavimaris TaxID=2907145 RepID=A0ABS8YWP7_9RHOB|nr:LapA family protein [Sinirhodobacter sp. WL0062]MCE5974232.1 LapA family protein [Sinirhodobacter sp. WL0062]
MFRILRLLFLASLALVLIVLALANREVVTLRLLPPEAGEFLGLTWGMQVPLFLVIFAGILLGLLVGFVWEWMREYRIRSTAVKATRKAAYLEGEVDRLREKTQGPQDDVLALLEKPAR